MNKPLVLLLILMGCFLAYSYNAKKKVISIPSIPLIGTDRKDISQIKVLSGHEFEITYVDGRSKTIRALLSSRTTDGCKNRVVKFLNSSSQPKMIILNKMNDIYVVDIVVLFEGKSISLTDWLVDQNLILSE